MSRLPRSRRGKTAVDVTITRQDGLPRVRLTMGEGYGNKNTDMDEKEVLDLITLLTFKYKMMRGEIDWEDG